MNHLYTWTRVALAVGALTFGANAIAQQQGGLVNVNVSDIAIVLADVLDVDISQVPVTVQAPIGVAANVCNVDANVLASAINQTGAADCDATTTSTAFNNIVQRQIGL